MITNTFRAASWRFSAVIEDNMNRVIDQGVEHAFGQINELLSQSKAAEAAEVAINALKFHHNNPSILRQLGVTYMILGLYEDAEMTMIISTEEAPNNSAGFEQLGNFYATRRRNADALDVYRKALALAPGSVRIQACISEMTRRMAEQQNERIQKKPPRKDGLTIAAAMEALHVKKDIQKARRIVERVLDHDENDVEAINLLASITLQLMEYDTAEALIKKAIALRPGSPVSHNNLGFCYLRQQKFEDAVQSMNKAILLEPQKAEWHHSLGNTLQEWGKGEEAKASFERALAIEPDNPNTLLAYGLVLQYLGADETIEAFKNGISKHPNMGEFYFSLSNLKTYRFEPDEIDDMEFHVLDDTITDNSKVAFNFALGKAHEDSGDYKSAFHYFDQGNKAKRSLVKFEPQELVEFTDNLIKTFDKDFFEARKGWGHSAPDPLFIVGLPRSGSTLVEQILASHSKVDGTKELPDMQRTAEATRKPGPDGLRYPLTIPDLSQHAVEALGKSYIDRTRFHRADAPFFTDKFPSNFTNIGFIHLVLPNATIIDTRRRPLDTCFSTWKQLFGLGQNFTYSMDDIALFYRQYDRIMKHWDEVLPGKVLRCQYENVVGDLEGSAGKLLSHCNLDWEEAVTRYYETDRVAQTASSEQVKQPIYTSGMDFWENYRPWLGRFIDDLGTDLDIKEA